MKNLKNIQHQKLSEEEVEELVYGKKRYLTHNIFLMGIYLALIIISLFIL